MSYTTGAIVRTIITNRARSLYNLSYGVIVLDDSRRKSWRVTGSTNDKLERVWPFGESLERFSVVFQPRNGDTDEEENYTTFERESLTLR